MIYSPVQKTRTARLIARTAQQKIKNKTGMTVNVLLCPESLNVIKTPERMLHVIAIALNMGHECYKKRSRERNIVELRFIAATLLRAHFPHITLQQIAAFFGGLDHSSVISGLTRANDLICTGDLRFIDKYNTALRCVNTWLQKMDGLAA
jgi:chromosomal replication initiation ATPase DnaA